MARKIYGYLKIRLMDMGITYSQIAKALITEPSTVSNKLNGKSDFRLNELATILDMIGETDPKEICKLLNLVSK